MTSRRECVLPRSPTPPLTSSVRCSGLLLVKVREFGLLLGLQVPITDVTLGNNLRREIYLCLLPFSGLRLTSDSFRWVLVRSRPCPVRPGVLPPFFRTYASDCFPSFCPLFLLLLVLIQFGFLKILQGLFEDTEGQVIRFSVLITEMKNSSSEKSHRHLRDE